ncbi:MAG TPA: LytR C-terminal domain-containing protein [Candidatus Krumholzibacteria bacterium]|nr:LytR C-terminal domain-containing protein [Candidatus Krumholzibacteria bacterium]
MPASKSRKKRNRRAVRRGLKQKFAVGLSIAVLIVCGASVGFSLFVRQTDAGGNSRALRLAIENGTGAAGIAGAAEASLSQMGVDVVRTGNAASFDYAESMLVVRRRGGEVRLLADRIGCAHVVEQLSRSAVEDATLILGADCEQLKLGLKVEKGLAD